MDNLLIYALILFSIFMLLISIIVYFVYGLIILFYKRLNNKLKNIIGVTFMVIGLLNLVSLIFGISRFDTGIHTVPSITSGIVLFFMFLVPSIGGLITRLSKEIKTYPRIILGVLMLLLSIAGLVFILGQLMLDALGLLH